MRSIKARFQRITKEQASLSDYICLAGAVSGRNFTRESIGRALKSLVDPNEYDAADKRGLIEHLYTLTVTPCAPENRRRISLW